MLCYKHIAFLVMFSNAFSFSLLFVYPPTVLAQQNTSSVITVKRRETRTSGKKEKDKLTVQIAVFLVIIN